jgi:hypothetical protein
VRHKNASLRTLALLALALAACSQSVQVLEQAPTSAGPSSTSPASNPCSGVDLDTDPHHCGACDHDCGAALCTNGRCAAEVLYDNPSDTVVGTAVGIAVDADNMYWAADPTGIMMMPKDRSSPARHIASVNHPIAVAVDDARVYWSQADAIMALAKDGSGAPIALGSATPYGDISTDDEAIYYLDSLSIVSHPPAYEYALTRVSKAGGDANALVTIPTDRPYVPASLVSHWMTVSGSDIFFSNGGTITQIPAAGGAVAVVVANPQTVCAIAASGTGLWVMADCNTDSSWLGFMDAASRANGTYRWTTRIGRANGALALADGSLYFIADSVISKISHDGSILQLTDPPGGLTLLIGIAVDERFVYWTEADPPRVSRAAR